MSAVVSGYLALILGLTRALWGRHTRCYHSLEGPWSGSLHYLSARWSAYNYSLKTATVKKHFRKWNCGYVLNLGSLFFFLHETKHLSFHQRKIQQYRAGNINFRQNKTAFEISEYNSNLQRVFYARPTQLWKRTWNICLTFLRGRLTFSLCISWCISSMFSKPSPFLSASSKVCFTHVKKGQEKHFSPQKLLSHRILTTTFIINNGTWEETPSGRPCPRSTGDWAARRDPKQQENGHLYVVPLTLKGESNHVLLRAALPHAFLSSPSGNMMWWNPKYTTLRPYRLPLWPFI